MDEQKMTENFNVDQQPMEQPLTAPEEQPVSQQAPETLVPEPTADQPLAPDMIYPEADPVVPPPVILPDATQAQPENEFVLDPDVTIAAQEQTETPPNIGRWQFVAPDTTTVPPTTPIMGERVVEPVAPIMPQIQPTEYRPVEPQKTSRGMRVFAVIVAVMVALSAAVTGGYFLGLSRIGGGKTQVDLAKKPSAANAMTASEVYQKANPSVVGIYVYNESGLQGTASGVIYSADGYVVTNDHIYDGVSAAQFKVFTNDGKMYAAKYVAGDTRSDLAVLKMEKAAGLKAATFGNSDEVAVGEVVIAVGRPNGAEEASTASEGIVSATSRRVAITSSYNGRFIQTDSAINPGSSGGALYNLYGQVIGITSAKLVGDEYDGVGFAIPTMVMKPIVESLITHKTVKGRARLGISYQEITRLSAEMSDAPAAGLMIAEIDQSSDLYGKAVAEGDVITHANGIELTDADLMLDLIEKSKPGDVLTLRVHLTKKETSVDISVKLLEDTGTSSYLSKGNATDDNSSLQEYNSSAFDFPNGD